MPARVRKSTSRRRYPLPGEEPEKTERRLSPQEKRRQIMINAGVWFLVLVFAMTSGVMCYNIGDESQRQAAQQAETRQVDKVQAEIDRWLSVLETRPDDAVALANVGYYYAQKARQSLPAAATPSPAAPSPGATPPASPSPAASPAMTQEQAYAFAADYLQKALAQEPTYAFALQTLAEVRAEEKKFDEARELLNRIIKNAEGPVPAGEDPATIEANRNTQKAQAWMALAAVEYEQKNPAAALENLEKAIEAQPGNADAYLMKASILQAENQEDQALEVLAKAIGIAEQMKNAGAQLAGHIHRSQIFKKRGDKDAARKELEKAEAVARGSGNIQAMLMVSQMLYALDGKLPAAPPLGLPTAPPASPAAVPASPAESPAAESPSGDTGPGAALPAAEATEAPSPAAAGAAPAATPAAVPASPAAP